MTRPLVPGLRLLLVAVPTVFVCLLCGTLSAAEPSPSATLRIAPGDITLDGRDASQRLVIMFSDGQVQRDVTGEAEITSADPGIAGIQGDAVVPVADGATQIIASWNGAEARVQVQVAHGQESRTPSFELDIQPILSAQGCSTGACHGKARGQNGFALSLLGFDSDFDHASVTRDARGRRVFPAAPERSLLLRKATGDVPHGGGIRFDANSRQYQTLRRWIEAGAPRRVENEPTLVGIELFPTERLLQPNEMQRLIVTAHYSDGSRADVTEQTTFQSNEEAVVAVDRNGLMKAGPIPGEAAIMARFMGTITVSRVAIPLPGAVPAEYYAGLPRQNFIDELVWNKLAALGITVSDPVDDARFLRRVYLDLIGRLPEPAQVRAFLASTDADKRIAVVDELLNRPEYADYWANKWADLLRPNPYRVGIKAVWNYDNWIRTVFRENWPYDRFARELITAQGSTWRNGAATMFRDRRSPDELATLTSQLFLGIRLECAKCHHHVFEKWSQEDFYSFAAYFARVGRKGTGLSPPISGGEEIVFTADSGSVSHPLTGKVLEPRPLYPAGDQAIDPAADPREALADWMTHPDNTFFAQVAVNRVWADLMGRGLVDPVDDLRATNPASNEALLQRLAEDFRDHGYDFKHLLRTIATSYVYGLSSEPTERNVSDIRNYSRHYRTRLRAEVLWDAIGDITSVPAQYSAMPRDARATQIWTHRTESLFLDTFGRPDPNQDPPCERTTDTTVTQALHLMNAPELHEKVISDRGRAAKLAASDMSASAIAEELYLLVYSRMPTSDEQTAATNWIEKAGAERRSAVEDLMWALMNTPEFVFAD